LAEAITLTHTIALQILGTNNPIHTFRQALLAATEANALTCSIDAVSKTQVSVISGRSDAQACPRTKSDAHTMTFAVTVKTGLVVITHRFIIWLSIMPVDDRMDWSQ
jgi:hypothetical protein